MYSVSKMAEEFNVSRQAVLYWIRTGKVKAIKVARVYRIPDEEIERIKKGE